MAPPVILQDSHKLVGSSYLCYYGLNVSPCPFHTLMS